MCSFGWLFYVLTFQSCWHQRLFGWNDCFCAGNTVYQPVTVVTPQGQVVTQAISPGTIHIQNSQVCRAHTNTFTHNHKRSHWSVSPSTSCSSSFSSIRTWVSLVEMITRLKTSVVFSPSRLPVSCAPGSSSTLRLVGKQTFKVSLWSFVVPDIHL